MGKYQSGQMGQTVNLLSFDFGGSNPSLPTKNCGSSSVDRALAFQAKGREFEPRLPLHDNGNTASRRVKSVLLVCLHQNFEQLEKRIF